MRAFALVASVAAAWAAARAPASGSGRPERPDGIERALLDELARALQQEAAEFPELLSRTGAFADTSSLAPATSAIPFDVRVSSWSDGAVKRRWISLPGGGRIAFSASGPWRFPEGTVLIKHFERPRDRAAPLRLETRLLVRTSGGVRGASYRWLAGGDDAELVREGTVAAIESPSGGAGTEWFFPGPRDCLECHTSAAGHVLGLRAQQLDRATLRDWGRHGLFERPPDDEELAGVEALPGLADESVGIERRARAWLDVNCASCHLPGGPIDDFDARYGTPVELQRLIDAPARIDLGLDRARRVAPNDPWRSVSLERVRTIGPLRMPPLGRLQVDARGVELLSEWIASLPGPPVLAPPAIEPAGFDASEPVTATLRHDDPAAEIRYTLDGSAPAAASALYEGPLRIDRSATLRARAFRADWTRSIAVQETFLIRRPTERSNPSTR